MRSKLPYVKIVTAKGKRYAYFDTGTRKPDGKPIYTKLPPIGTAGFGDAYASCLAGRTRRANVAAVLTVPALIDFYERSPEFRRLAPATQRTYGYYLDTIGKQLNNAPAGEVERRDVLQMRAKMGDRPGAANGMIRTMRALWRWAGKNEHVTNDPCAGIELFESDDYEPWPDSLLDLALAEEDLEIRLPVALLYYTAQRIGDVCALRWSDVRDGYVHLRQQKTGKDMEIKLATALAAELDRTPKAALTILSDSVGRPRRADTLRRKLQGWAAERGHKIVPHGLRKNAVNALLEHGCSVAETAAVSGQSLKMVEHYAKRRSGRKLSTAAIHKLERAKA